MILAEMQKDGDWRNAFDMAVGKREASYEDNAPCEIDNVSEILACVEGEKDGAEWVAVGRWSGDGQWFVMAAGCCYTGWDCQARGSIEFYASANDACSKLALTDEQRMRLCGQLVAAQRAGRVILDWE